MKTFIFISLVLFAVLGFSYEANSNRTSNMMSAFSGMAPSYAGEYPCVDCLIQKLSPFNVQISDPTVPRVNADGSVDPNSPPQ